MKAISGVMTVRFKNELVRNITIKLGYANAKAQHLVLSLCQCRPDCGVRSTSARIPGAHDQDVTDPIVPIRKITPHANDRDADLG